VEHGGAPPVYPAIKFFPGTGKAQNEETVTGPGSCRRGGLKGTQGPAGASEHLQRPEKPVGIVGVDPGGAGGIAGGQFFHQGGDAPPEEFFPKGVPDREDRRGSVTLTQDKIPDIKAGSPGQHRQGPPGGNGGTGFVGQTDKVPGIELLIGVADVYEVMGYPGPEFQRRLGGTYIHTPVDLHGIGGHNLPGTKKIPGHKKLFNYLRFT
jgi:hypothetical protein